VDDDTGADPSHPEDGEMVPGSDDQSPKPPKTLNPMDHPNSSPAREARGEMYHGVPMPISANPNVPDPTIQPAPVDESPSSHHAPIILSLPGTPSIMLSPVGTPGLPMPISVPVPSAVLKAMHKQQALGTASMSGLFTPAGGSDSQPGTPDQQCDEENALEAGDSHPVNVSSAESPPLAMTDISIDSTDGAVGHSAIEEATTKREDLSSAAQVEMPLASPKADHLDAISSVHSRSPSPQFVSPFSVPAFHQPDSTTPTLHPDPYPYSLSTPGSSFVLPDHADAYEGESLSEGDNEDSTTSSSTVKRNMDSYEVPSSPEKFEDDDMELAYPSETESKTNDIEHGKVCDDLFDQEHGDTNTNGNSGLVSATSQDHHAVTQPDLNDDPFEIDGEQGSGRLVADVEPEAISSEVQHDNLSLTSSNVTNGTDR
jgi:hypothetical protein